MRLFFVQHVRSGVGMRLLVASIVSTVVALVAPPLSAQTTRTWNVTSGTWAATSSWDGGTAASTTDPAFFSGAGAGTGNVAVLLGAGQSVLGVTFSTGSTTVRSADGTTRSLNLGAGGLTVNDTAGAARISVSGSVVNLGLSASQTFTSNSSGTATDSVLIAGGVNTVTGGTSVVLTLSGTHSVANGSTISGAISGAAGREISVIKTGAGSWRLTGNNTYAGTTTIAQGTVRLGNANALGSGTGGTVVQSGGNAVFIADGTYPENITITGTGVGGSGANYGALNFNLNSINATLSGAITLDGDAAIGSFHSGNGAVAFSQGIGGTGNLTLRAGAANNGRTTFSLNGQSTYTGRTTFTTSNVSGTATFQAGIDNALPTTTVLTMAHTAASSSGTSTIVNFRLRGFNQTLAGLSATANSANGSGTVASMVTGGSSTLSTLTLNVASGTYTYAAGIGGAGTDENNLAIVKAGAGTQVFSGANTYAGQTTISGGTLSIGSGGTSGSIVSNVTNNATLIFNRSDSITYSGTIDGSGGIVKDGAGVLTLGGSSTYAGDSTLLSGNFRLGVTNALPATTVLRFGANGTNRRLQLQGYNQTLAGVTDAEATGGILILESASDSTNDAPATLTLNVASGTSFTFSGYARDAAGGATNSALSLVKNGAGTQVFSGAGALVNYSGPTTINAGVLEFSGASSVSANSAITLAGGTVRFSGGGTKSNAIAGTGSLEKAGANLLTLTGNNTFEGALDVLLGGLLVNGIHSGTGLASVAGGARIGGDGSLAGGLTLASGGLFVFNPSTTLDVTGAVTLANSFSVDSLVNFDGTAIDWGSIADGTYTLINTTSTFDTIANFGAGNAKDIGGGRSAYFQNGSLQLVIVPEPGALALAGLGIAAAAWARRRRD